MSAQHAPGPRSIAYGGAEMKALQRGAIHTHTSDGGVTVCYGDGVRVLHVRHPSRRNREPAAVVYGVTNFERKQVRAHQAAYRVWRGEVPPGMQLDHLCRNRACFNPEHLECVTARENTIRGTVLKMHCPKGHEYDEGNTYINTRGHRVCRACVRAGRERVMESRA